MTGPRGVGAKPRWSGLGRLLPVIGLLGVAAFDPLAASDLEQWLGIEDGIHPLIAIGAIMLATLVSEDLAAIATGVLIAEGTVSMPVGMGAVFAGIWLGDIGLWLIGRGTANGALRWQWAKRKLEGERLTKLGEWLEGQGWKVILFSRMVPATRLPLYLGAGFLGWSLSGFALWTAIAVALWTPLIVGLAMWLGPELAEWFGGGLLAFAGVIIGLYVVIHLTMTLTNASKRRRLAVRWYRLTHHEFWPTWLLYTPVVSHWVVMALHYRGLREVFLANPKIPDGGIAGEAKSEILDLLPPGAAIPWVLLGPGAAVQRWHQLEHTMTEAGWEWPLILKPDQGERGAGVRKIHNAEQATAYLSEFTLPVVAQVYHPGPIEVGLFYYRWPNRRHGTLFSITEKIFPVITGDGVHSLGHLIEHHPRYRLQLDVFKQRLSERWNEIPAAAEQVPLAMAGNHCQGTLFLDGEHLRTPELEAAIDAIGRNVQGFHIGRFDIRCNSLDDLRAGRDLGVVELNGLTSESTNIYDPKHGPIFAIKTLCHHWHIALKIGRMVAKRDGIQGRKLIDVVRLARRHYAHRDVSGLAD